MTAPVLTDDLTVRSAVQRRSLRIAMIGQRGVPATYGGVEHHVEQIGSRLADRGHDVTVHSRVGYASRDCSSTYLGMRVVPLPTLPTKHLEATVHSAAATLRSLNRRYDIVHYHALGPGLWSPLAKYASAAKVVQTIHGLDHLRGKWGTVASTVLRSGAWLSARVPDAIITVSKDLDRHYRALRDGVHRVPNGVAPANHRPAEQIMERFGLRPASYVLFVGRLVPEKAVDVLIRAFAAVDGPWRLVIAGGSGFSDDHVRQLESAAACDPRITMTGYVYGDLLAELYSNAAAFVAPSRLEGLPLTVLEAASYGLPVVASAIPPHTEILGRGSRTFPVDDVSALRAALTGVLRDVDEERRRAKLLQEDVLTRFDWDTAADQTEAVYASVLGIGR